MRGNSIIYNMRGNSMKTLFALFFCLISSVCLAADWTVDKCWVTNDIGIATNPNINYLCAHIVNFPNFEKDYDKICLIDNTTGKEVGDFWGKKDNTDTIIYEIDKNKKIDLSNLQLKFAENKVKIEVDGIPRPVIVPKEVYRFSKARNRDVSYQIMPLRLKIYRLRVVVF